MTSTDIGFSRQDVHTPVNFMPENYSFVGCFHNTYSFGATTQRDMARNDLLAKLQMNERPNGPGVTNCDHCGAAIAFVGVFQHRDGDFIAVGSTCAEKRFPMTNAQFQLLRKAHRLCRTADLAREKFEAFKADHVGVDWAAAEASSNRTITYALAQGRKYGSLFDYRLEQINRILAAEAANAALAAAPKCSRCHSPIDKHPGGVECDRSPGMLPAPPAVETDLSKAEAFLRSYDGENSFLNSLKSQVEAGRMLSPKQVAAAMRNFAPATNVPVTQNQDVRPGCYIDADGHVWQVKGNQAYVSGAKRARQAGVPHVPAGGERVYAKVWVNADSTRVRLDEARDASQVQSWAYIPGGIQQLVIDHKMTLAEAKTFIEFYKECVRCGRHLEADASLERGIGPVCVKYFEGFEAE